MSTNNKEIKIINREHQREIIFRDCLKGFTLRSSESPQWDYIPFDLKAAIELNRLLADFLSTYLGSEL